MNIRDGVKLQEEEKDPDGSVVNSKLGGQPYPGGPNRMRMDDFKKLQESQNDPMSRIGSRQNSRSHRGGDNGQYSMSNLSMNHSKIIESKDSLLIDMESLQSNVKDPAQLPELKEAKMRQKVKNMARSSLYDKIQIKN